MATPVQDRESIAGPSARQERPLGGYAALMGVFVTGVTAFAAWMRGSGRRLPEKIDTSDLALMTVATHKASRLVSKDRVTSSLRAPFTELEADGGPGAVREKASGSGLRRAIGELITCPYCISLWIAAAFAAGFVVAPRPTRWVASILSAVFGSDLLQIAYKKAEDTL
jgi:hypothetical protein